MNNKEFAVLRTKAQSSKQMRWRATFAVGAWWQNRITVSIPAPKWKMTEEDIRKSMHEGIDINPIVKELVAKADEKLDKDAATFGVEPPVQWDLALLTLELI